MNAQQLRERNRYTVTLKSGLSVTIEPPDMLDCMIDAEIPMPVIHHLRAIGKEKADANGQVDDESIADELSLEELGHMRRANLQAVCRGVKALEGEELEEPLTLADVAGFTPEELNELVDYLKRNVPLPLAGSPA